MTEDFDPPDGAYAEGREAFAQGWPRANCPYPPGAEERDVWLRGWDEAAA